jgi:ribonuclease P protein component
MAFPLRNRLKKQKDFEEVFTKGKTVKGSFFFCKVLQRGGGPFRYATVVSSKVSPKAVIRNRLRRRILSISQKLISPLLSGFDIVIVAQRMFEGSDESLREDVTKILRAARVIP